MPIITNASICAAHGYLNTTVCWLNYTITQTTGSNPNLLGTILANLPWFGEAIWVLTYLAVFILFHKSGGREKFMAMGIVGFLASMGYSQMGLFGAPGSIAEISTFALSIFIMIISIIAYALVKDSGE